MNRIYKYQIDSNGIIKLPVNAKMLTIDAQDDYICCWAIVDPTKTILIPRYVVVATGCDLPTYAGNFIKTIQLHNGNIVVHIFEYKWFNPS